jgi:hypothetical protein
MTVAMIHLFTAPAGTLESAWSGQFKVISFGDPDDTGPRQAHGPQLPAEVRGITLAIDEPTSAGVTLFDSYADARQQEPALRDFWAGLAGTEVAAGAVTGVWQPADDGSSQPARMIWIAPAEEPEGTRPT